MSLLTLLLFIGLLAYTTDGGVPQLLFSNRKNIQLVDIEGTQVNTTVVVSGLEDAAALDFILDDGGSSYIYWTDISLEAIKRVSLSSGSVSVIVSTGLMSPDGLACDWIGRKLYWTDSEVNRIEVSDLDGQMRKVLFRDGLDQPRALALYPQKGWMFWTDWGEIPKIERASMAGDVDTRQVIISTNIFWPNGLTLDYATDRLYWADGKIAYIHSSNLDGSDRREIIRSSLPHPFALTLFQGSLFWTDWQTKAIYTCNKTTGTDRRVITSNLYSPMDIHVYHFSRQPHSENPCGSNNGGCSHLCLMSPTEPYYRCACPTGVRRLADNKTCADGPSQILLLVRRTDLRWVSLDTMDYTDVVIDVKDIQHAIAIDYDPVERHIYWTDDESRSIRRAFLDGSGQEVIFSSEIDRPDGVAVDWIARNIYWTDTGPDRIEVARLNGTSRKVLISEDLVEPRAIVVDPLGGRMFWSDWGTLAKIERANLDGSNRLILVNVSLGWPNGLTIDYADGRIYWGDAKLDRIESCDFDGSRREILVQHDLPHIFGLTLLGDYLYWTDWIQREVGQVHKKDGSQRRIILEQLPDLMGLKAANVTAFAGENNCSFKNGGCSHLCLNRAAPLTHVCACPSGHELLPDDQTCIVPEAFLLYSRRSDIRRISLEASNNDAAIPLDGVKAARALDFDVADNRIYWSDIHLKSINRAFMNGTSVEHLIDVGLDSPESLVVDWIAHNLYWADSGTERIEMAHIDGSSRLVLVWHEVQPHSIAVDPHHGYLYWSNWMNSPRLERSNLDGSLRSTFVNEVGRVNGITIDFDLGRLFMANVDNNVIESVSLSSGGSRQLVVSNLPHPFGLTQFRDFIYWTDWETKSIERADKLTGMNRSHVHFSTEAIMDVSIFHSSRQTGWNECGYQNGRCSHLCVTHSNSTGISVNHYCACPTHYVLAPDNRTCLPPAAFLLYSQRTNISRMIIDSDIPDMQLPIANMRGVRAIEYDPVDNYVYWIDGRMKNIRRARESSTNGSLFLPSMDSVNPFDFVIDPYSRVMFWTDASSNTINAHRLSATNVGVIIREGQPRYIAISAELGLLFWTSIGKSPKLERSATDGTVKTTLFSTGLGMLGPLAVDTASRRVYWVDLDLRRIEYGDFDGGHRQLLVGEDVGAPAGLSVHGPHLYWTDRSCCGILERVNKLNGNDRTQLRITSTAGNFTDMTIVRQLSPRHPCSLNNGDCSHLCVVHDGSSNRRCSCPIGLALSANEHTCTAPPTCTTDQFTCQNGFCIPSAWRCDGYAECEDDSDEQNCTKCTLSTLILCPSTGQCISPKYRCDGKVQCPDRSDEENCPQCKLGKFRCGSDAMCIDQALVCNGKNDCADGTDEMQCDDGSPIDALRRQSTAMPYAIGIGLIGGITVMVFFIVLIICLCRQKTREQVVLDDRNDIVMVAKASPTITIALSDIHSRSSLSATNYGIQPPPPSTVSLANKSRDGDVGSESLIYDRDHITGASSSSSTTTAVRLSYPKETLNPPPSPVTDRSRSRVVFGERRTKTGVRAAVKAKLYKRRRKHYRMRSPATTPCSTDVCEDSESYVVEYCIGGSSGYAYESDPLCPPPPTPYSQYLSEEPSCPPSPRSTEYSFFVPYPPPPPSTAGSQDC